MIGILHEGAEQRCLLHEAKHGKVTRFEQAECSKVPSAHECFILVITYYFVISSADKNN